MSASTLKHALSLLFVILLGAAGLGCRADVADLDDEDREPSDDSSSELRANAIETWAFCGVDPNDPHASLAAKNLARAAGINATMGPCMPPGPGYTAAFPGQRYVSPNDYLRVLKINAAAGMKTIVYDARLWSDDAAERERAYRFWAPHLRWVRAWDMGDEFDPRSPEWAILVHRWDIMINATLTATHVGPFTNHLPFPAALERALAELPRAGAHLSFDLYDFPAATTLASAMAPRVSHLMCAANALPYDANHIPTRTRLANEIVALRFAGCDSILVFGGSPVVGPREVFGSSSLVDANGRPTSLAAAVRAGAR